MDFDTIPVVPDDIETRAVIEGIPTWVVGTSTAVRPGQPVIVNVCANQGPDEDCTSECKTFVACHPSDLERAKLMIFQTIAAQAAPFN